LELGDAAALTDGFSKHADVGGFARCRTRFAVKADRLLPDGRQIDYQR